MGTSSAYGGPGGRTPLVPSWLPGDGGAPPLPPGAAPAGDGGQGNPAPAPAPGQPPAVPPGTPPPPPRVPIPPAAAANRFSGARSNFTRFARSGGNDRRSLGRSVSNYVSSGTGGARRAAQRMGSSRASGGRLFGFLSDVAARGAQEALRALRLDGLAGRPIEEIFLGLADYVCPDGGTVDEGIAREAFIETIADLAQNGITDMNALTAAQMQTVFELYATHAIEARLCNDIGTKTITLPSDIQDVANVQAQLHDFIRRGVADALTRATAAMQALTPDRVMRFVGEVYEQAFTILQTLGDAEAETS